MSKFFLLISLIISLISAFEISSKIDLDSEEECSDSARNNTDSVITTVKSEPEVNVERRGFRASGWRPLAGRNFNVRRPGNSMRSRNNQIPPASPSNGIKNIYIVINGKDVDPPMEDNVDCKDKICETTISIDQKDEDNEIESVRVTVVTKPKSLEVENVPVIDGIRATGYDNRLPTFVSHSGPSRPNFMDNDIPQGQVPRRSHLRPASTFFYSRAFGRPQSTAWNSRIPGRIPVDDKIEPPLSKTDRVPE